MLTMQNRGKAFNLAVPEVLYNDKIFDALALAIEPDTRLLTFEGTIRSAKTVTAVQCFHLLVQRMTAKYALIAAENYDAIRTNLLQAERGLMTLYPDKYHIVRAEIGGFYIEAITPNGLKEILLCGYSDASKWEKILGKDIEVVFIDEVNIADSQFVKECFARQGATEHPVTLFTLNGDDPNHEIYSGRINKSLVVGHCPATTRADMDTQKIKKRGYYYMWWSFDDNPKLTYKQKLALRHEFPVGSYYHKTKILGERGKWGVLIFADYMTQDLIAPLVVNGRTGNTHHPIDRYVIGVDIAEGKAHNVYVLMGYDKTYSRAYVVDRFIFKSIDERSRLVGFRYKTELLRAFLKKHQGKAIECISVDSAEMNYINDLKGENLGLQVIPSFKATIKARIDLVIILMNKKRLLFDTSCKDVYEAFQSSTWVKGKEGQEREDSGAMANDIMDATEYALTVYMTALSTARGRNEVSS